MGRLFSTLLATSIPCGWTDHSSLHTEEEAQRKLNAEQTMEPKLRGIFLEPRLF